jgi:hypothetical protein
MTAETVANEVRALVPSNDGPLSLRTPERELKAVAATVLAAAEVTAEAILDLDLEFDHYVREVGQDGAGMTCVGIEPVGETGEEIQIRIHGALTALVNTVPELTDWKPSVTVVEGASDDEDEPASNEDLDAEAH